MRQPLVVVVALLLAGCSSGGGGASADPVTPTRSPAVTSSSTPTPTVSPTAPTPESQFAAQVDRLYTLVKTSVEDSGDPRASSEVLKAFATTVALVKLEPEQEPDRQRVVDAARAAARAYETAAGITNSVERAAALRFAQQRLQELEVAIRTLPGAAPAVP